MLSLFRLRMPSIKSALLGGAAVVAIISVAYWVFEAGLFQPNIIQRGQVTLIEGGSRITVPTRLLSFRQRSLWQFEVSPGDWRDCGNDCEKAVRSELAK